MDFQLTESQRELIDATEKLCRQLLPFAKEAHEAETKGDFAPLQRLRRQMAEAGLLALNMPQEYGGMGLPLLETLLLIQTIQRVDSTLGGLAHRTSTGAIGAVLELGTQAQKTRFVGGVARGEIGVSIGITEPDAGSAATAMKTRARIEGDDVIINGQKIFISAAKGHHYTMLYCRFGNTGRASDIGAIMVPHDAPGFSCSGGTLNMAGERQYELYFDDCRVPKVNILAESRAFAKLISVYNVERLGSISRMLGSAQAAFEFALQYVQERKQFGRELADFQGLQWMLADMKVKLEAAQMLTYRAASNTASGLPSPLETSVAKVYVAQAAKEICDDAIQLLGGYGYMAEYPVEGLYREVRGGSIYGGTLQIHKNMIAGHLLGRKNSQWAPTSGESGE
ncbi:acyl-CoA dehydrogenase family protein [Pandoraea commovens]|uniref:Acyl-CoA dehydrogenase, short-chain specific n=1 Tax=Pandoraea commovens TaxID=2508289 RepID=A0A5E4RNN1_9BURK|nr:acyl-CoA dehydrogenase family protein [Pandoraea commovens]VVD64104.1 Acyl-CoA dehydrogenase, short-chain specific [Pandoraea commovens]